MNDFDRAARFGIKEDPTGQVRYLLPKLSKKLRYSRWLDSQSAPRPGEADRRCDTIMELTYQGKPRPPLAVVLELFSGPDADASDRLLEYIGRFRRELRHGPHDQDRYDFCGVLLFLRDGPALAGMQGKLEGQRDVQLIWKPRLVCLAAEDAVATLQAIEENRFSLSILIWIPLMKGGQSAEVVKRWRTMLEQKEANQSRQRTLASLAITFAELTRSQEVWRQGLEGVGVNESSIFREIRTEARREAHREERCRFLLRLLRTKPGELSLELVERIEHEQDPEVLEGWLDQAWTAATLDAFAANMDA